MSWDANALWPTDVTDAVSNTMHAAYDPYALTPREVTDPNGNRTQVAFDVLGRVVATWTRGKTTEDVGDSDALPGTLMEYHDALAVSGGTVTPPYVRMRARQAHRAPDVAASYEEQYVYSDGFGRVVQTKVKCEPEAGSTDVRWLGTGRTIYNNKGLPVKQYEPFFATGPGFETETWLVTRGHTAVLHYDPLGRLVRTDLPDGTFTREAFTPWAQTSWDANDTVLASRWYAERAPTSSASAAEKDAAVKASAHANTPSVVHFDTLGRPYRAVADLGGGVTHTTRVEHDVTGHPVHVFDALGRVVQTDVVDLAARVLKRVGLDTGTDRMLPERAGQPMRAWTANGYAIEHTYDTVRRPVAVTAQKEGEAATTVQWTRYGEEADAAVEHNLRGRVWRQYDGAGRVTTAACDFKGYVLEVTRRLATSYAGTPDWSTVTGATSESLRETAESGLLADEEFTTTTTYDARNRPTQVTPPHATNLSGTELFATRVRAVLPRYNVAGLLDGVDVVLGDDEADPTAVVTAIVYNERRQRTSITHGNGVSTAYEYEDTTLRLARLHTTAGGSTWQDLRYTYDPVGNITRIADEAQQTLYFGGAAVEAGSDHTYDALYRLIAAAGRELAALTIPSGDLFEPLTGIPHDNDVDAVRRYTEQYEYDAVGNFERMRHRIGSGPDEAWVREYLYAPGTNRLVETTTGGGTTTGTFDYDDHGNMIAMSSVPGGLDWNWREELSAAHKSVDCTVHFQYDASGQRIRKVLESRNSEDVVTSTTERLYLGGWELSRERVGTTVQRAVQTCAVLDGEKQVALIETRTVTAGSSSLVERVRYQYPNHLGTACLELDADGAVMTYEEYLPYGQVAYSVRRTGDTDEPRRYRYTGMEQDETGLQYHSARYYAPWLGRWTSPDPIGIGAGCNVYAYALDRPLCLTDSNGCTPQRHISALQDLRNEHNEIREQTGNLMQEMQADVSRYTENLSSRDPREVGFRFDFLRRLDGYLTRMRGLADRYRSFIENSGNVLQNARQELDSAPASGSRGGSPLYSLLEREMSVVGELRSQATSTTAFYQRAIDTIRGISERVRRGPGGSSGPTAPPTPPGSPPPNLPPTVPPGNQGLPSPPPSSLSPRTSPSGWRSWLPRLPFSGRSASSGGALATGGAGAAALLRSGVGAGGRILLSQVPYYEETAMFLRSGGLTYVRAGVAVARVTRLGASGAALGWAGLTAAAVGTGAWLYTDIRRANTGERTLTEEAVEFWSGNVGSELDVTLHLMGQ